MNWYLSVLFKCKVFDGRSHREEYWMFTLCNAIVLFALMLLGAMVRPLLVLFVLYSLAITVPKISVTIRRLHDTGRIGWWCLINLVPVVGWIVFLVYMVQDSQSGTNQYGLNPKGIG